MCFICFQLVQIIWSQKKIFPCPRPLIIAGIYYVPQAKFGRHICVCSVSYYSSSSSFFLSSAKSLSNTFLVDYWTEINEMLSTMSRCADYFRNFQNGCRCHGNGQNAKKIEKHKNDHSKVTRRTEIDETW